MICAKLLKALLSRDGQRGAVASPELLDEELLPEEEPLLEVDEVLVEVELEELLEAGCPPVQAAINKCEANTTCRNAKRRKFIDEPS